MNPFMTGYGGAFTITPSDSTLLNLRALYVGGAGNISINVAATGGTTVVITAPPVGSIIPIRLEQGRVMAATTATALVGLQ